MMMQVADSQIVPNVGRPVVAFEILPLGVYPARGPSSTPNTHAPRGRPDLSTMMYGKSRRGEQEMHTRDSLRGEGKEIQSPKLTAGEQSRDDDRTSSS